jgi:hypothetical protein
MATERQYKSLKEFYPYYLTEHQHPISRGLHYIGTGIVIVLFFLSIIRLDWRLFVAIPLAGYGFAWFGHAVFEKNKPATFTYPLWSLASDFIMFWHITTGQIGEKIAEARATIYGTQA